jgi:hypothetical protein
VTFSHLHSCLQPSFVLMSAIVLDRLPSRPASPVLLTSSSTTPGPSSSHVTSTVLIASSSAPSTGAPAASVPSSPVTSAPSSPFATAPSSPVLSQTVPPIPTAPVLVLAPSTPSGQAAGSNGSSTRKRWSKRWRLFSKSWHGCAAFIGIATTFMFVYYTVHTYNLAAWTADKDYCEFQRNFEVSGQ